MAKVMLVEDDNNLREIYEARLLAEGYEIVSARDGEEALALAVKEKPDLIISDIMMPKISGFDMLDILRTTPETKNTKVIMMTALSQAEDKDRADKLGADRYLVKSQVTLEDVARVAREVLEGDSTPPPAVAAANDAPPAATNLAPVDPPAPDPAVAPTSSDSNNAALNDAVAAVSTASGSPTADDSSKISSDSGERTTAVGSRTSTHDKVIKPLNDINTSGPNLDALLAKEEAKEAGSGQLETPKPIVGQMDDKQPPSDPGTVAL